MADNKIPHDKDKREHHLGGTKDADLEGIDASAYDVFTTDKNLQAARDKYPTYDWFACFSVKDKSGNYANITYTLKFDKPAAGKKLYYFLNDAAHEIEYSDDADKGNKKRVKATLTVGDPPVGMG
jgi:hypothetical protein